MDKIDPMQAMVNEMEREWQKARAKCQMTLGKMIERLSEFPPGASVTGVGEPHSYRGYYVDLSFAPTSLPVTVADVLKTCREECMGQVFEGYKGGDYLMGANTPVWIASYGCCGERLMSLEINESGVYAVTAPDNDAE